MGDLRGAYRLACLQFTTHLVFTAPPTHGGGQAELTRVAPLHTEIIWSFAVQVLTLILLFSATGLLAAVTTSPPVQQ